MNLRPFTLPAHLSSHIGIEAIFPIHGLTPNLFKQAPSSGDEGYPVQVWYWTSHFSTYSPLHGGVPFPIVNSEWSHHLRIQVRPVRVCLFTG